MVASRQVELPYCRAVGWQRGRGFVVLAQVVGRTEIPILRKNVVPAAKRSGANMLEIAAPQIGENISGIKPFKSAAMSVGKQTLKKQLGSGSKQRRIFPTKSTKQSCRSRRDIFTIISRWSCQTTIFGTNLLWQCLQILERSPNCWRCPVLAWTRDLSNYFTWWKQHWVLISNGSELLRWLEAVFLALKLRFVKGRGYDTYESKQKKKEHNDESVIFTETGTDDSEEEVARVTYVNNMIHSIYSNVELYITNPQINNSNGLYAHKFYISNNLRQPSLNRRELYIVKVMTMNRILRIIVAP